MLEGVEFVCILREYPDPSVVFLTFDLIQAAKLRIPSVSGEGMKVRETSLSSQLLHLKAYALVQAPKTILLLNMGAWSPWNRGLCYRRPLTPVPHPSLRSEANPKLPGWRAEEPPTNRALPTEPGGGSPPTSCA